MVLHSSGLSTRAFVELLKYRLFKGMCRDVRRTSQAKSGAIEQVGEGVKLVCFLMLTAVS